MSNGRPTCWRLSFCFVQDRRPPFRHPDEHLDYLDEAAARRHYNRLKEEFGASVVASVTPVWPKPPDISSKRAKLAALVAAGMPEQLSPRAAEKRARRDAQRQRKPGKP
jgi:hypothetical protein